MACRTITSVAAAGFRVRPEAAAPRKPTQVPTAQARAMESRRVTTGRFVQPRRLLHICSAVQDDDMKSELKDLYTSLGFDPSAEGEPPADHPRSNVAAEIAANKAAAKLRAKRQAANRLKELDGDLGFLASEEAMKAPLKEPAVDLKREGRMMPQLDPDRELPDLDDAFLVNTAGALLLATLAFNLLYGFITGDI